MNRALVILALLFPAALYAQTSYPVADDMGWVDVTAAPYSAACDGATDDTSALQDAIDDEGARTDGTNYSGGHHRVILLPVGTCVVSDTLQLYGNQITLRGAGPDHSIIKLEDSSTGFDSAGSPKAIILSDNHNQNAAFDQYILDIGVEIGTGNDGAVGIDFTGHNRARLARVNVDCDSTNGVAGIQVIQDYPGPLLLQDVEVDGCDIGVYFDGFARIAGAALDGAILNGQGTAGIDCHDQVMSLANITSTNTVPAVRTDGCITALLHGSLTGGDAGNPAVDINGTADWGGGTTLLADVTISGYGDDVNYLGTPASLGATVWNGSPVTYYSSTTNEALAKFDRGPSPDLAYVSYPTAFPVVFHSATAGDWNQIEFGDSQATTQADFDNGDPIQWAFHSSGVAAGNESYSIPATVKYIELNHSPATHPESVSSCNGTGPQWTLDVDEASGDPLTIRGFTGVCLILTVSADRVVHVIDSSIKTYNLTASTGRLYLSDTISGNATAPQGWEVYSRQHNQESTGVSIRVEGRFAALNYKSETNGTKIQIGPAGNALVAGMLNFAVAGDDTNYAAEIESGGNASLQMFDYSASGACCDYDHLITQTLYGSTDTVESANNFHETHWYSTVASQGPDGKGYMHRPCGFDLDDDGIVGEATDDCNICDATSGTGVQAADWDGDGTTEGEIYVSASGTDSTGRGGPDDPYATPDYAFADGAGSQAGEDVICQIGNIVATTILDNIPSGDAGSRTISGGKVEYPYDLPTNPTMWICADSDDDGQYAPFDTDDTCKYDNNTTNYIDMGTTSDVEIAGIEFDDPADDIFTTVSSTEAGDGRARWYIHDTVWSAAANGFKLFSAGNLPCLGGLTDVTVENSLFDECDATSTTFCWLWRGSLNSCGANPYQTITLRNSTFLDDAVSGEDSWQWVDMWPNTGSSHSREMQILENYYECTGDATWCTTGTLAQGSRDIFVGYNRAVGVAGFLSLEYDDATFGTEATNAVMYGLKVHGNEVTCRDTDSWCNFMQINSDSGDVTNNILGSIEITGNVFDGNDASHATDRATFIYLEAGTAADLPNDFLLLVEGNTVYDVQRNGLVWAIDESKAVKFPLTIRNNIMDSASTSEQLFSIDYDVAGMAIDYNTYNGGTTGSYDGGSRTLAQMDSLYGLETNSDGCAPVYVDAANGDFRLASSDTCAVGAGTTPSEAFDAVGARRGSPYDRGALAFTLQTAFTYLRIAK